MRTLLALSFLLPATFASSAGDATFRDTQAITDEILTNGQAYEDLRELTTDVGARLSGSEGAAKAVEWAKAKLEGYGFDNVTLQPMTAPHWVRGVETASLTDGGETLPLRVTALGGSVGTPAGGLTAEVIEVQGLDEVDRLGAAVRGKIVFYNRPMDPTLPDTFEAYGRAVDQRSAGPSRAAKYGAVAVLVRTMTTLTDDIHPHTGMLSYRSDAPKVPAAAIATRDANTLSRRIAANPHATVTLTLGCEPLGTTPSFNVYAELKGSEHPEEIVAIGGHLDSWDLGAGAHDDGTGVVQSIEALRAIKALGLQPKRTIRVVLWMSEEQGGWGARDYATAVRRDGTKHIAAIESDRGGFAPVGFETDAGDEALAKLQLLAPYLSQVHADQIVAGGSGTDVEPLAAEGAVTIGYVPESKHYFDYHHAATDQFSAVRKDDLHGGAAAIAVLAYVIANQGI